MLKITKHTTIRKRSELGKIDSLILVSVFYQREDHYGRPRDYKKAYRIDPGERRQKSTHSFHYLSFAYIGENKARCSTHGRRSWLSGSWVCCCSRPSQFLRAQVSSPPRAQATVVEMHFHRFATLLGPILPNGLSIKTSISSRLQPSHVP